MRARTVFGLALLASFVVAGMVLNHPFVLDDITKIVENTDLRILLNLPGKLIYPYHEYQVLQRNDPSRPLVFFVYTILYAIFGLAPWAFHLVNLVCHAATATWVYRLARSWRRSWPTTPWNESFEVTAAALFVLSPVLWGTAIYAYGLSDVLSSLCAAASVGWALQVTTMPGAVPAKKKGKASVASAPDARIRWLSVIALVLGLACKQSVVAVPVLVILWWFSLGGLARVRERAASWLPLAATVVFYLAWRFLYFGGVGDLESYTQAHPADVYAFAQPWVWWRYVQMLLVPVGLSIDHFLMPFHIGDAAKVVAIVAWIFVVSALIGWRKRRGVTPWTSLVLLGLGWFFVALAPTSSLFPTVDLLVERRVYLASFGIFWLVAAAYAELRARREPVANVVGGAVLLVMTLFSVQRARSFATPEQLWRDVLSEYPTSQRGLNSLASILNAAGRFDEAEVAFETALKYWPEDYVANGNFGAFYERPDNPHRSAEKALMYFRRSAELRPTVAESHYNIGRLLHLEGRLAEAEPFYVKTLELKPNFVPAWNNLGAIYLARGDFARARGFIEKALSIDPTYAPAQQNKAHLDRGGPPKSP